jgi:hypothetical protein
MWSSNEDREKLSGRRWFGTSFNIGAGGATELSVCDYSADPEMRWTEGEGENERRQEKHGSRSICR